MNKYYSLETKANIIQQYSQGASVTELSEISGVSRSTIYQWIDKNKQTVCKNQNLNLRDYIGIKLIVHNRTQLSTK